MQNGFRAYWRRGAISGNIYPTSEPGNADAPAICAVRAGRTTSMPLSVGLHRVGGSLDCDLILQGTVAEVAFRLMVLPDRSSTVEILSDKIYVNGERQSLGDTLSVTNQTIIELGDTEFRFSGLKSMRSNQQRSYRRMAAVALLVAASMVLAAGVLIDPDGGAAPPHTVVTHDVDAAPTVATTVAEIREAARLASVNVDVAAEKNGATITIRSHADPLSNADYAKLASIISAIQVRSPVPIEDNTSLSSGLQGFVDAVGYQPFKFIVGRDGKRYREGDSISDGWRIGEIRNGSILLTRADKQDVVRFERNAENGGVTLAQLRSDRGL